MSYSIELMSYLSQQKQNCVYFSFGVAFIEPYYVLFLYIWFQPLVLDVVARELVALRLP